MNKPVSAAKKLTVNDVATSVVPATQLDKSELSKKKRSAKVPILILSGLLLLAIGFGGYMYWRYQDVSGDPASAVTEKNQAETARVLDSLKKRLLIGETDAPTVARVEDPEKLKKSNAEFYKDIQKGDYLIIYPKRAIIYRETNDQIINVAPIINTADLKSQTEQQTAQDSTDTTKE